MCFKFSQTHFSSLFKRKFLHHVHKDVKSYEHPSKESKHTINNMKVMQKDEPHLRRFYEKYKGAKSNQAKFN